MENDTVKLVFLSHGMPFIIPGALIPKIGSKVDEILGDMEAKRFIPLGYNKFTLPTSGFKIDYPKPNGWVLVDADNASIILRSMSADLVTAGSVYVVLPYSASTISTESLMETIEIAKSICPESGQSEKSLVDTTGGQVTTQGG